MSLLEKALNRTPKKLNVRGRIRTGCMAVESNCPVCKKAVKAIAQGPGSDYTCLLCGAVCVAIQGKEPGPISVDYFILPTDVKSVFPERPQSIRVIPAYKEIENMCQVSYKKKGKGGKVVCKSQDGKIAKKTEYKEKYKPVTTNVPCAESCADRAGGRCKEEAVFSFILPDVDVFSVYLFSTTSDISKINILSTLKNMIGPDGLIARTVCDLELHQTKGATGVYNVFQLNLPRVKLADHEEFRKRRTDFAINWAGNSDVPLNNDNGGHQGHGDGENCRVINVEGAPIPESSDDNPGLVRLVRERNKEFLKSPYADQALELYACKRFSVNNFDEITKENLLELYKGLGEDGDIASQVYIITVQLRSGAVESLPFQSGGDPQQAVVIEGSEAEPAPESERVLNGRQKVLEKLKRHVNAQNAEAAVKEYIIAQKGKSFDALSVEELLKLWHDIGQGSDLVLEITKMANGAGV
ncbi:MAG: hypothetical protein ACLQF0_09190 [Dissulfurispiraceae bacterium]